MKISALPRASSAGGGDLFPATQALDGKTRALTLDQMRGGGWIAAMDLGVVANTGTDQRAALQAAINAAQAAGTGLILPAGVLDIAGSGLTISKPIAIRGAYNNGTRLNLLSGTAAPAITVAVDSYTSPQPGIAAEVSLGDLMITAPDRTDAPGQGVAHGIAFLSTVATRLVMERVTITGVPGDGLHAANAKGWVEGRGNYILYPNGYGIYANSVSDWRWFGGEVAGAGIDNIVISGGAGMQLIGTNFYVPAQNNVQLFGPNVDAVFVQCYFDLAGRNGVWNQMSGASRAAFIGCHFRWSSQSVNQTYCDIFNEASSAGTISLIGCDFKGPPNPFAPNFTPNWHIFWNTGAATPVMLDPATTFETGAIGGAHVISDVTKLTGLYVVGNPGTGGLALSGQMQIRSASQFDGFILENGTDAVAKFYGTSPSNDKGTLNLLTTGTPHVQLSADTAQENFLDFGLRVGPAVSLGTNSTANFLLIPFMAGTPTGVPANAGNGIAVVYDTTAHKLWAYDNIAAAWKSVALS